MELSPLLVGILVAAPQLTGSLLRIPFGAWVDKVGGRLPMLTLFGISIVGMWGLVFILVTVPHVTRRAVSGHPDVRVHERLRGRVVLGRRPAGLLLVPANRQGTALGIYGGVGNLAPGLFTLILPFAIAALGLAGSYLAWLAFLLIGTGDLRLAGARCLLLPASRPRHRPDEARDVAQSCGQELFPGNSVWGALITAADETRTWGLMLLYFVSFGGFLALTAWFPTYWINLHHLSLTHRGHPRRRRLLAAGGGDPRRAAARSPNGSAANHGRHRAFTIVLIGAALLTAVIAFPINVRASC